MAIWANHAHVFPAAARPTGTVEALLQLMDGCGIERAVAFAPFSYQIKEFGIDANAWVAAEVRRRDDRLVAFGTVDVHAGDIPRQMRQIGDLGMPGIKLHPAAQRFDILSAPLLEVYAAAQAMGLFVVFHTGVHAHRLRDYRLIDFDEIAHHFPTLRFSLEHVGGYAFFREAVGVIQNNAHRKHPGGQGTVYAGLTSVFSPQHRHWYMDRPTMQDLVALVGEDRIIFGLDFPYNSLDDTRLALQTIQSLDISAAAKEKILGSTLRTLLATAREPVSAAGA
jgi:uncharacterized protein